MKAFKHKVMELLLLGEIILFGYVYFWGDNGIGMLYTVKHDYEDITQQVMTLQMAVNHLEAEITEWNTNDFLKEKIAREQLHMARVGDEIYYI